MSGFRIRLGNFYLQAAGGWGQIECAHMWPTEKAAQRVVRDWKNAFMKVEAVESESLLPKPSEVA